MENKVTKARSSNKPKDSTINQEAQQRKHLNTKKESKTIGRPSAPVHLNQPEESLNVINENEPIQLVKQNEFDNNIDLAKKLYRGFIEKSGLKDAIIRSIVCLYEEGENKPDQPINYLSRLLGYGIPSDDKIGLYEKRIEKLHEKLEIAREENFKLKDMYKLKQLEYQTRFQLQQKCNDDKQRQRARAKAREEAKLLRIKKEQEKDAKYKSAQKQKQRYSRLVKNLPAAGEKELVMKVKVPTLMVHQTRFTSKLSQTKIQQDGEEEAEEEYESKDEGQLIKPLPTQSTTLFQQSFANVRSSKFPIVASQHSNSRTTKSTGSGSQSTPKGRKNKAKQTI